MSSATASLTPADHSDHHGRPTFASLISGEVLRLRSRRLVKVALVALLLLVALGTTIVALTSGPPSAAERSAAQSQANEDYTSCLQANASDPNVPQDVSPQELCGSPDADAYLTKQPYDFANEYPNTVIVFAVGVALLMFLIGASAGVLGGFAVLVSLVGQVLALTIDWLLSSLRGSNPSVPLPDDFWLDALSTAGRGMFLAVLIGWAGFALANLTRNTGAALGIAFVYFAIVENVVGGVLPRFARWLVAVNVGGYLNPGGIDGVPTGVNVPAADATGLMMGTMSISNARGGLVLTLVVLAFLAVATILFTRRDIT
jgi:hypothetical protein